MTFEYEPDTHTAFQLAAIAQPGDTILLAFRGSLTDEDIEHLEASFQPFRDRGVLVAFTDQVEAMVVVKGEVLSTDDDINDWGGE